MLEQQIYSLSSFSGGHHESDAFTTQLVNCHAVLSDSELCARVNTVPGYLDINRMVSTYVHVCIQVHTYIYIASSHCHTHSLTLSLWHAQIPSHLATFSITTTPTSAEPSTPRIKVTI